MTREKLKLRLKLALISAVSLLSLNGAMAQTKVMTLDDAIKYSLEKNFDTKSSLLTVQKANAAVKEAFGYALPTVDLSASFSRFINKPQVPFMDFEALLNNYTYGVLFKENVMPEDNSKMMPMGNKLMSMAQSNNYETKAQITQILFSPAVFKGIGATESYLQLAKDQLKGKSIESVTNIRKAFYGVILSKELLKILQESLINAQENLKNLQAMKAQGLAAEFDVMQVEVQVENIKPQIKQLENSLKNAENGVKVLIGMEMGEQVEFIGELNSKIEEISDERSVVEFAMANNYDLRTLNKKIEVDQAYIDINKSEYWPQVAAFGSLKFAGSSDDWSFMNYSESMVGVSLQMNLFNGYRTDRKVEQSQVEQLITKEQIIQLKSYIESQIRNQVLEVQRVRTSLEAQEKNVKLAEKAYSISTSRFEQGTGTQLEIKNSDMELRSAKTNLLQSVFQYMTAMAELDKLTGTMSSEYIKVLDKKIDDVVNKNK